MHYQTKFKINLKPENTRKPSLVKDYLALNDEYNKLKNIYTKHDCSNYEGYSKISEKLDIKIQELESTMLSIAGYKREYKAKINTIKQNDKTIKSLRSDIAKLTEEKASLRNRMTKARNSIEKHKAIIDTSHIDYSELKTTNGNLRNLTDKLKRQITTLSSELEQLEVQLEMIENSKFSKAIIKPFIAIYNKIKSLWS